MNDEKEYNKLRIENEKIRKELGELIGINHPAYSPLWDNIHRLITNEIEMEGYCNE